jgi:hypothetical protein
MILDIGSYDAGEARARRTLSNTAQMAFAPATFMELGYPVRVGQEIELLRFVDSMHEFSACDYYSKPFAISPDEAQLITELNDRVVALTRRAFNRPLRPWTAQLSALEMFRVANALGKALGKDRLTVLEIGPGSGYLGAMLALSGHRLISMDNAQAYYLWQNRLYTELAGDQFAELANSDRGLSETSGADIVHLPWWRFAELHTEDVPSIDLLICDHAFCEIKTTALQYILRQARRMISDGLIAFCYFGHSQQRDQNGLFREFHDAGFEAVFKRRFYAVAPNDSRLAPLFIPHDRVASTKLSDRLSVKLKRRRAAAMFPEMLALDAEVPLYRPSGRSGSVSVSEIIPLRSDEAAPDYAFVAATGIFVPASEA